MRTSNKIRHIQGPQYYEREQINKDAAASDEYLWEGFKAVEVRAHLHWAIIGRYGLQKFYGGKKHFVGALS